MKGEDSFYAAARSFNSFSPPKIRTDDEGTDLRRKEIDRWREEKQRVMRIA